MTLLDPSCSTLPEITEKARMVDVFLERSFDAQEQVRAAREAQPCGCDPGCVSKRWPDGYKCAEHRE